jgi:hypothetical protein
MSMQISLSMNRPSESNLATLRVSLFSVENQASQWRECIRRWARFTLKPGVAVMQPSFQSFRRLSVLPSCQRSLDGAQPVTNAARRSPANF